MSDRRLGDPTPRGTALYLPVKRFLEKLGFQVRGEICGCDVVALRGDEAPVVVVCELKLAFNLELLLQGVVELHPLHLARSGKLVQYAIEDRVVEEAVEDDVRKGLGRVIAVIQITSVVIQSQRCHVKSG